MSFMSNVCGSDLHMLLKQILLCIRTFLIHNLCVISKDCNRFHAGEVLPAFRSKGKNQLFDERGVFGRVCRHDFPKSLLNIQHCER